MDNIIKKKEYNKKILLIEDNPNDIRSIQEMFKNFDNKSFEMILKTTLSESIESIKENIFSIILLNPFLSGYQEFKALEIILKENLKIPIIVLIEKDDRILAIEALKCGAQEYLIKNKMDSTLLEKSILYTIERNKFKIELEELTKYLKLSDDRYKAISDIIHFPIFILNPQCKIVNANEKAIDLFEFSKEELLNLNISELIDIKFIDTVKTYYFNDIYRLENSKNIETLMETKNHKKLYIEIISTVLRIEGTTFILSYFLNITERKKHDENREKFLNKLQQSLETKRELYTSFSHEFRTPLNAIIGFSQLLIEEYYGDLNENQKEFVNDILSSGDYLMNLLETISEDISDIITYKDKNSTFNNFNKYVVDATSKIKPSEINYKAEQDLNQSDERYQWMNENIKEGYYEADLDGNFNFFNRAFLNMLGFSQQNLLSKNFKDYIDDETSKALYNAFNTIFKNKKDDTTFEFTFKTKEDYLLYLELSIYLRTNSSGKIIGFKGFVRDITERKQIDLLRQDFNLTLENNVVKRTKELQDALEQQKRYLDQIIKTSQFKTEFMATMSHELRTPLNAIIGFTELLLEGSYGQVNKDQFNFLQDIKSSAEHQFEMIYQILDISKIESGQMTLNVTLFLLNDLINQIVSTVKPLYTQKGLEFKIRGLDSPKKIVADSVRLKEIIYNLLTNAIKFTIKGRIKLIFDEDKENWIFLIKDTGIGIDKKDYDLIFKDFKRINSPYVNSVPGTGLGLALTRRLVQLHNGKIWFESELGKGSTFFFTIPKILT